ncbi:hypothetical protein COOONC_13449 [Cooperia oncophora]
MAERHRAFVFNSTNDVMVDRVGVEYLIDRYSTSRRILGCRVLRHGTVVRNPASKWYLSSKEYNSSDLGTYCQGMAYVFSGDQLRHMRENIPRVQYLWVSSKTFIVAFIVATATRRRNQYAQITLII